MVRRVLEGAGAGLGVRVPLRVRLSAGPSYGELQELQLAEAEAAAAAAAEAQQAPQAGPIQALLAAAPEPAGPLEQEGGSGDGGAVRMAG